MRKVIVEMDPNIIFKVVTKDVFRILEYIEGRALLKMDIEKCEKITIYDIKMKPGYKPEDLSLLGEIKLLDIMKQEGDVYTCLAWGKADKKAQKLLRLFRLVDLNIIYDLPLYVSKEKFIFSVVGDNDTINKMLRLCKMMGKVRNVSFQKAVFSEINILSCLTEKQREVITEAKKLGYYEYPRKVSSKELAEKLGISRATTIEHLRKAEGRLIEHLMADY